MRAVVISGIDPLALGRLVDRKSLFLQHWRFRRRDVNQDEWNRRIKVELEPMFMNRLVSACQKGIFEPAAVSMVAPAFSIDSDLLIPDENDSRDNAVLIHFARNHQGHSLTDLFPPLPDDGTIASVGRAGWFVSTLGHGVARHEAELREQGRFEDYHLFHGMAAAMAEALAGEVHQRVASAMCGLAPGQDGFRPCVRFSPGYRCCPDLSNQGKICAMLGASRIGVAVSETFQMVPEMTVSAIVVDIDSGEKYY